MARDTVWDNSDGLVVGFGTRSSTKTGGYSVRDNGATQTLILRFRGEDLTDAVAVTDDQIVHGPVIPNGAILLSATIKVVEAFDSASDTATLDIGVYDVDGAAVDDDGIDSAVAETALSLGAEIAANGADINTAVATTGGVRIAASYDTEAFTTGEAIVEVEYELPQS